MDEYKQVTTERKSLVDMLAMDFEENFDFEPPILDNLVIKSTEFD